MDHGTIWDHNCIETKTSSRCEAHNISTSSLSTSLTLISPSTTSSNHSTCQCYFRQKHHHIHISPCRIPLIDAQRVICLLIFHHPSKAPLSSSSFINNLLNLARKISCFAGCCSSIFHPFFSQSSFCVFKKYFVWNREK